MHKDIEFASVSEIKAYQERLLQQQLHYLQQNSPFYQRLFANHNIDIRDIKKLEDLNIVPFTEKTDLHYNSADFLCCTRREIVDYSTTSGTTGEPVTFAYTENDLQRQALNEYKSFIGAGVTADSVVQLMLTMDKRFIAGMAYCLGLRKLGAGIIRVGNGIPELQWDTICRVQPDVLMCVPSFILRLIEYAQQHDIDYRHSSVRKLVTVGEGIRNQDLSLNLLGQRINDLWPEVAMYSTYSSTEMGATFSECECQCGGHVHPELVIIEVIGENDLPVPDGELGEIVMTTLGVEAMPLLRFRTGDIAAKIVEPCACGRNSYRLTPILGRKHNMLKIKGTTIYPPAFNDVLDDSENVQNYIVYARTSDTGLDSILVRVGLKNPMVNQKVFVKELKDHFRARLRVAPDIEILPVDVINAINFPAKSRKQIKFIDERNL